jgi:hypothetical protein
VGLAMQIDPDGLLVHKVVVGNVGTVYEGLYLEEARASFDEYVPISESGKGRAGDEEVTLFTNGEIEREHIPYVEEDYNPNEGVDPQVIVNNAFRFQGD